MGNDLRAASERQAMNRRRKKRVPCPVCKTNEMIFDWLMCDGCFKAIPSADRKVAIAVWREVRPFVRHHSLIREEPELAAMLFQNNRDQCAKLLRIAREQHR